MFDTKKRRVFKWAVILFSVSLMLTSCALKKSGDDSGTSSSVSEGGDTELSAADSTTASTAENEESTDASTGTSGSVKTSGTGGSVVYDSDDMNTSAASGSAKISLNGSSGALQGSGATLSGSKVTITSAGTYTISGTLNNGQIIVNTSSSKAVHLILNGVNITCSNSAPVYIKKAEKVVITLNAGTNNSLTDGSSYVLDNAQEQEPNAALFSKSDLTVNGSGSLSVKANYNDGIASKDALKITGGTISVTAANDGIQGKDYVAVKDAVLTVNAKSDGIKSTNDTDTSKGFVTLEGKKFAITSGGDAVQAETNVLISGGSYTINTGGGSANGIKGDTVSAKGLKAAADITIKSGTLSFNTSDDAVHSNNSLAISGGSITITSGDDGIHSDTTLRISGGTVDIQKSYEGIESAAITISGGTIHATTSDDGINVAGGNDGSSMGGRPGQNNFSSSGNYNLTITGGYIYVNSTGDGLDANGSITMTGGTAIVMGPTANNNGALDYDGGCKVTGGILVAAGSSGMAQAPDTSSTQYSVIAGFDSTLRANTIVNIQDKSGNSILSFSSVKQFQSIVLCSPSLKKGETYKIYYGGSATGTAKDGIYSGGKYSGGTLFSDFTVSGMTTTIGNVNSGPGGGGGGGPRPW